MVWQGSPEIIRGPYADTPPSRRQSTYLPIRGKASCPSRTCLRGRRWNYVRNDNRPLAGGSAFADRGDSALYAMLDDHGVDEPENGVLVVSLHGLEGAEALKDALVV